MTWKVTLKPPKNMTWKVTLTANRKYDLKSHSNSQPKNMTWKVTIITNRQYDLKSHSYSQPKIWLEKSLLSEMHRLKYGREKEKLRKCFLTGTRKNEEKGSLYIESETLFKYLSWAMWNLNFFFLLFFFKFSSIFSFVLIVYLLVTWHFF